MCCLFPWLKVLCLDSFYNYKVISSRSFVLRCTIIIHRAREEKYTLSHRWKIKGFLPFWNSKWKPNTPPPLMVLPHLQSVITPLGHKCKWTLRKTALRLQLDNLLRSLWLPPRFSLRRGHENTENDGPLIPSSFESEHCDDFLVLLNWPVLTWRTAAQNAGLFVFRRFQWLHLIR